VSDIVAREAWRAFLREPSPENAHRWALIEARSRGELADGEEWLDRTVSEVGPALDLLAQGGPARVVRALERFGCKESPPTLRALADTHPDRIEGAGCGDNTLIGTAVLLEALGVYREAWSLLLLRAERVIPGVVKEVRRRASTRDIKRLAKRKEVVAQQRLAGASWTEAHQAAGGA
jgi:hypothetical protein